jgi:hypothetical protein
VITDETFSAQLRLSKRFAPEPYFIVAGYCVYLLCREVVISRPSLNLRIAGGSEAAVEAAENGLLALELASGIARINGVRTHGVRVGNWLSLQQAQALLNAPDIRTKKRLRDRAIARVNIDYHIAFDTNYYSVPYNPVHELVEVRSTPTTIEIS